MLLPLLFVLFATALRADPPSQITVDYNKANGNLFITFVHQVQDPVDHFIYDARILLNKKEIIHQSITSQDTKEGGTLVYKVIDVKAGNKFNVILACNKYGKKNQEYTIK